MSYQPRDLQPVYDPAAGYTHFVLYTEPKYGTVGAAWNGTVSIERESPYVQEWLGRLQPCEPNTLHTTLVESDKIASLFHPGVDDDKDSPSAVGGSGCLCFKSFMDPEFGLPVVAHHYRTVGGNIDQWTYKAYAPLDLRPDDEFYRLIIDRTGCFWIRTRDGLLSLLPEENGRGYGTGYGGGGPTELAQYITRLLDSGGEDTAAAGDGRRHDDQPDPNILAWVSSKDATRTQELTFKELAAIQRG
ncbi:hypothetical protein [Streptomyces sp. NBC_00271]|uniref:hypothetical protein n=1 Tax=Streptomyces sp. NBC_00271 TaxID=2975697 RepID=UPI002E2A3649|nr:hypothetical protein [Streptomyces sp. NBC_00271]